MNGGAYTGAAAYPTPMNGENLSARLISTVDPRRDSKASLQGVLQRGPSREEYAAYHQDLEPQKAQSCRERLRAFIEAVPFQSFVSLLIVSNAVVIGYETDSPDMYDWERVEFDFLIAFGCELTLRLLVYGCGFFTNQDRNWNVFDFFIVNMGLLDATAAAMSSEGKSKFGFFSTLLRTFRLLRIMRLFRIFRMLKQLYLVASSFVEALSAVFWVSCMCFLSLYVCAIVMTRALRLDPDDKDYDPDVAKFNQVHYGNIATSMFSLFELMAHPNLETVEPVIAQGSGYKLFFVVFVIIGSWAMLSLLTGVMSEHMVEKSAMRKDEMKQEIEDKRKFFVLRLAALFRESDRDGDGMVSRVEFHAAKPAIQEMLEEEGVSVSTTDLEAVFDTIDFDNSGSIDIGEFLNGMSQLSEDLASKHVLDLQYAMLRSEKVLQCKVDELEDHVEKKLGELKHAIMNRGRVGGGR